LINLNYRDPRPIYEQVKDNLRHLIVSGALPQNYKLPSVREMAGELAINPNTIQRAYRELENEGYICTIPGKGSFTCPGDGGDSVRRGELLAKFDEIVTELRYMGLTTADLTARMEGVSVSDRS
jgi:GntR family transcriptional regulator